MSKIAVLGYGVVGSGTVELFYKNRDSICKKTGKDLDIKYILDLRDFPDSPYADKFVKDFNIILEDKEVDIVAEVIGGATFAYDFTKKLLENGKSVVTSNKELVATKGAELLSIAKENNCNYMFEASVGGGIPIIRPIHQCLAANEILSISGILNGTTNFIMTKMIKEKMSFETALKLAQDLGYAEKDPTADVEGHDASRKICILASLAFGKHVYPKYVHNSGISNITLDDIQYAQAAGYAIKLIGTAQKQKDGKISAICSARFVPNSCLLASVDDVFNAILVNGDGVDDVMFYGRGAGKLPTASAVVADIIDVAKANGTSISQIWADSSDSDFVINYNETESKFFIRAKINAEEAQKHFGEISIINLPEKKDGEIGFITKKLLEIDVKNSIAELNKTDLRVLSKIRILDI